ncbi:MAG: MATE family efflux transporter [Desulfobacula sp.]|jgi:putative MATE family efflux protein|nr:MATE family efflux transporter [Desulfobacula sp.]
MKQKSNAKLVEGDISKILYKMTLPMIVGIFGMIFFNLVDTYFIGLLGVDELAAISFTFPVIMIVMSISMGLGIGASSVISREIGTGNMDQVKRYTTDVLILSFAIVILLVILGLFTLNPLFQLLGAKKELIPLIRDYMIIWYAGVPLVVIPMVGNSVIRATGDTKSPGLIMMVAVLVNLIMDPLLIFGIGPFPRLELKGAAIATLIARACVLIFAVYVLHRREKMISLQLPALKDLFHSWRKILYIALPISLTNLIAPVTIAIITMLVADYGKNAVAAFGITSRLEMFSLVIVMALSTVIAPFTGQNYGAKKYKRIIKGIQLSTNFSIIYGLVVMFFFILFSKKIASIFTDNQEVVQHAQFFLIILSVSYGANGIIKIATSVFNAINKPLFSTILILFQMVILLIPMAFLGSKLYGLKGIFIACTLAHIISGFSAYFFIPWMCTKIKN